MATAAAAGLLASQAYLEGRSVRETRSVFSDRCRQFYRLCWVTGTGTGGSITIKAHDDAVPKAQQLRVMSPSGVQAERMVSENMYVLSSGGQVLSAPSPKPQPQKPPKCTDCAPLFMKAYQMRHAGAVTFLKRGKDDYMFSGHPLCNKVKIENIQICVEISTELWILPKIQEHELSKIPLFKKKGWTRVWSCNYHPLEKEFKITHMEMIKGIQGHGYHDELVVPMMENTTHERELTESLSEAMAAYPKAIDVLVRNYGIYVWGNSWINVKTQAECYHYLSDAALKLHQLGVEPSPCNHGPIGSAKSFRDKDSLVSASIRAEAKNGNHVLEPSRQCIVLDIEGTTTPISFVADVLFPYARDNVRKHLISTYDTTETKEDIELLRLQVEDDLKQGISGAVPIPSDDAGKKAVIDSLVSNVEAMIIADRKITSLKQLQGHIWRTGFANKELQGIVYEDVPEALKRWHANGMKVYIYSSGSREAQRLIFGNTTYGDLRKYLCGYFDTAVGNKRESHSYFEIFQSVGVDKPSQILFLTDVYQEAIAAKAAGLEVLISVRPGNVPLPDNHGFQTITSFAEI